MDDITKLPRLEIDARFPRMEVEAKWFTFRFYNKHPDRYDASFQMFVDGDTGNIHTLNGNRFFQSVEDFHRELFLLPRIRYIRFFMMGIPLLCSGRKLITCSITTW